ERSGIDIQCHVAGHVEVVASAVFAGPPGDRVAGAIDDRAGDRVVSAWRPRRSPAVLRRRGRVPRLEARLTGGRDGVERPEDLAGLRVEGQDAAVHAALVGTGRPEDDLAVGEDRTGAEAFVEVDGPDLGDPALLARGGVHGVGAAIASRAEYIAVIHHDTTAHTTRREGGRVLAQLDGVDPLAVARRRVHGGDALAAREVHHAVVHDRRELRVDGALEPEAPGHAQVLDVLLGYLVER